MSEPAVAGNVLAETLKLAEEAPKIPIVHLNIGGIDLSVNMMVVTMWLAVALVILFIFVARRKPKLVPGPIQTIAEYIVLFVRDNIVMEMMGKAGTPWLSFLTTLFLFILFSNMLGLIPGLASPTGNISVPLTLALIVFGATHITGAIKHGPWKYFRGLVLPPGAPLWLAPLFVPLELIGAISKPVSLTIRLFANMLAGHTVLVIFVGLILLFATYIVAPFPLMLAVAVGILEIAFKILQAYVFTVLSAMYIGDAIHGAH